MLWFMKVRTEEGKVNERSSRNDKKPETNKMNTLIIITVLIHHQIYVPLGKCVKFLESVNGMLL
jgi:hypothetical protein